MPEVTVVVGASRGIGLGLVQQISKRAGTHVVAAMRKPLNVEGENIEVIALDQTDPTSVETAAKSIPEIDTLVINAAIGQDEKLMDTTTERLTEYLETNVIGVHRVIQAFIPALKARKTRRIIFISSTSGSLTQQVGTGLGFQGPYSVSKAAGNMLVVQYHNELHSDGFTVIAIHPGWVRTDMGSLFRNGDGAIEVEDSASAMLKVFDALNPEDSAKFITITGLYCRGRTINNDLDS